MAKQRQGRKKEKVDDKDDKDAGGGDDAEGVKYGDEEITLIHLSLLPPNVISCRPKFKTATFGHEHAFLIS